MAAWHVKQYRTFIGLRTSFRNMKSGGSTIGVSATTLSRVGETGVGEDGGDLLSSTSKSRRHRLMKKVSPRFFCLS